MNPRAALAHCGIVFAAACSDGAGPSTPAGGAFSAQLTGARTGTLSGTSNAGEVFTEEGNEFFAIRMFGQSGDVLRSFSSTAPARRRRRWRRTRSGPLRHVRAGTGGRSRRWRPDSS